MKRTYRIVLSCEHAGNRVPAAYRSLFSRCSSILSTHRGFDIGISKVAGRMARTLHEPLFACYTTRLLIDPNRSPGHKDLFSQFSKLLARPEKNRIIRRFYHQYRESVINHIRQRMRESRRVLHVSLHSFTPVLNDEKRNADIGILYDPGRKREKAFAIAFQNILRNCTGLKVRRNYPYRGNADGFTTALRKIFGEQRYLGIEVEINQALLMADQSKSRKIADAIGLSLNQILLRTDTPRR
jgi:predicted N-formylglutamate amidohydrolase